MAEEKQMILVVDDDLEVAQMLAAYLGVHGYQVHTVDLGEEAVRYALATPPDLVIQDIHLPDIDGFEVAYRLRNNRRTKEIPIIFLTEKKTRSDRLQGLELGADDYITKPFDIQELRLRVRNALRRTTQGTLTNPVTNLPEGILVNDRLQECLGKSGWAFILVSLGNLAIFRELYGFVAADDVLRAASLMIHNSMREFGGITDFSGHFSSDEFLLITSPANQRELADRIKSRIDQSLEHFYPLRDRESHLREANQLTVNIRLLSDAEGPFQSLEMLKYRLSTANIL